MWQAARLVATLLTVLAVQHAHVDAVIQGWRQGSINKGCATTCAEQNGFLSCTSASALRAGAVNSGSRFWNTKDAILNDNHFDATAPWTCTSYTSSSSGPRFDSSSGACQYNTVGGTTNQCDDQWSTFAPLCCCVAAGDDPTTVCPFVASDCGAGTVWDSRREFCVPQSEQGWRTGALGENCQSTCNNQRNGASSKICSSYNFREFRVASKTNFTLVMAAMAGDLGTNWTTLWSCLHYTPEIAQNFNREPSYANSDGGCITAGWGFSGPSPDHCSMPGHSSLGKLCCCINPGSMQNPDAIATECALGPDDCGLGGATGSYGQTTWDPVKQYCVPITTAPTAAPSRAPTTAGPTAVPSTQSPSAAPSTSAPSDAPSRSPTNAPVASAMTWGSATMNILTAEALPTVLTIAVTPSAAIAGGDKLTLVASSSAGSVGFGIFSGNGVVCVATNVNGVSVALSGHGTGWPSGADGYTEIEITHGASSPAGVAITYVCQSPSQSSSSFSVNGAAGDVITFSAVSTNDVTQLVGQTGYTIAAPSTSVPSVAPIRAPSSTTPSSAPTQATQGPSAAPTATPSTAPSSAPTQAPTHTHGPTAAPTATPSTAAVQASPTKSPST